MKALLLLVLVGSALGTCPGIPCANSNQCGVGPCSRCDLSVYECLAGFKCDATCTADSDCDQTGSCPLCVSRRCGSAGMCGDYCSESSPCRGNCTNCVDNKCVASCQSACTGPSQCSSDCPFCVKAPPRQGCGAENCCRTDYCAAGCNTNSDCRAPCTACSPSFLSCMAPGCGTECLHDSDCNVTGGQCTTCFNGQCRSQCGSSCNTDSDCAASNCMVCSAGACAKAQCGQPCLTNDGCAAAGCSHCNSAAPGAVGRCVQGEACGGTCKSDGDCDLSGPCKGCQILPGEMSGRCRPQ